MTPDIEGGMVRENVPTEPRSRDIAREASRLASSLGESPANPKNIALIGDSIGMGISISMRIPKIFSVEDAHLEQSSRGKKSIMDQLKDVDPQKTPNLIIQGGTNDLPGNGFSAEKVARNLIEIYQQAKTMGFKRIILVTIPPHKGELGKRADEVNEILRNLANQNGVNLFDLNTALKNNPDYNLRSDGFHPADYRPLAQVMLAYLRNPESITDVNTSIVEGLTTDEKQQQYNELEREHKAGALHGTYLEMSEKIDETTVKEDLDKLRTASIEDIRFKSRLLKPGEQEENLEDKIANLKEETARRIKAYTSEKNGEWYTLDYMRVGGEEHEYKIGLGDILVDPSIKHILVKTAEGKVIYAERGKYGGRVGFGVNGEYLATFTGDKFRILTEKPMSNEEYEKDIKDEDETRVQESTTYGRDFIGKVFTAEDEARLAEIMKQYNIPGLDNMEKIDSNKLISFFQNISGKELIAIRERVGWPRLMAIFKSTGLKNVVQKTELKDAARDFVKKLDGNDKVAKTFGGIAQYEEVLIKLSKYESVGWRPFNWSHTGAMGFYQFTGGTARNFIKYNPLNPREAVEQVYELMKMNFEMGCTTPQAILTAHNRGAGAVRRYAHNMAALPRDRYGNPAGLGFYSGVMKQSIA